MGPGRATLVGGQPAAAHRVGDWACLRGSQWAEAEARLNNLRNHTANQKGEGTIWRGQWEGPFHSLY
jgi:hypothetical protein